MEAHDIAILLTYIDTSYIVNLNMRSHTGQLMSFGEDIIHAKSSKQKLNIKNYTPAQRW